MSIVWTNEQHSFVSSSYFISEVNLVDIFKQADDYRGQRFFWRSADLSESFLGLGTIAEIFAADFAEINAVKRELTEKIFPVEASQPPLLFGGFPFDRKGAAEAFWGPLEQGYFVLPQILFRKTDNRTMVTLTVPKKKNAAEAILSLKQIVASFLNKEITTVKLSSGITTEEIDVPQWLEMVQRAVTEIQQPDTPLKKIVAARQLIIKISQEIIVADILKSLAVEQPNTYLFVLEKGEYAFIGATPERLLKADQTHFYTASIAGSALRAQDQKEDLAIGEAFLNDPKNSHEHSLVVAGIQEQLEKLISGNLLLGERKILKNRDIQHIYLPLSGQRKADVSFLAAIDDLHPTPALGGQPKALALSWLRKNEAHGRGLYGAPVGWLSLNEDEGEFAVGIRSGIFQRNQGILYAGCGIVAKSVPIEELAETWNKFQPMLRGVRG